MRFDISYVTRFVYGGDVLESQNELRAAPAATPTQRVLHYDVRTTPSSRVFSYVDYWGTRVDTFGVRQPHRQLEVVAESAVETSPRPVLASSPRFADLDDPAFRDEHFDELQPSPHVEWGDGVLAAANEKREQAGDDLVSFVLSLHRMIGSGFDYQRGTTFVGVDIEHVLAQRSGVCQDFAHLLIALCRCVGIPARYVSGYFFAADDSSSEEPDTDMVTGETHAWVDVAIPGYGWWGLDPTNSQQVGERHVAIGHGRDYDDVAPLRGVYVGPHSQTLEVEVSMHRASVAEAQQRQSQQQQQQ